MTDYFEHEEESRSSDEREVNRNTFISGLDTLEVENIVATRFSKVCFKNLKNYIYR